MFTKLNSWLFFQLHLSIFGRGNGFLVDKYMDRCIREGLNKVFFAIEWMMFMKQNPPKISSETQTTTLKKTHRNTVTNARPSIGFCVTIKSLIRLYAIALYQG